MLYNRPMMTQLVKTLIGTLAVVLFFLAWQTIIVQRSVPRFVLPEVEAQVSGGVAGGATGQVTGINNDTPWSREHWITNGETREAHSANLAFHNGELIAVWYGGSREGAADVSLMTSRFVNDAWTSPKYIMNRTEAEADLSRSIRKLGNPVLYSWDDNRLGLFYVTVSLGGWAGSSVNYTEGTWVAGGGNREGSYVWSRTRRLVTSPFLNISTLVRHTGIPLQDGNMLLPVYHEFLGKFGEYLVISPPPRLDVLSKTRLSRGKHSLQPAVAPVSETAALALLRYAGTGPGYLFKTATQDGRHWHHPKASELPNPNAAVSLINIGQDELLVAYNDTHDGRHQLALATKYVAPDDQDGNWIFRGYVELEPATQNGRGGAREMNEFSYPSLAMDNQGIIHLAYTWNRREIKHLSFNYAWLVSYQGGK